MSAIRFALILVIGWAAYVLGQQLGGLPIVRSSFDVTPSVNLVTNGSSGNNANLTSTQTVSNATGNWAGYVTDGTHVTHVSGAWTVPVPSPDGGSGADATWIGIGGDNSEDLIQTGTQNTVTRGGQTETTAFYEMLPDNEQPIDSLDVSPGDKMSAAIQQGADGMWTIAINDATSGGRFTKQVVYDSSGSSAEWIEEDPSVSTNTQVPLDNFGSATFSNAAATANGHSVSIDPNRALTIVNQAGQILATTSRPSGSGFTVTRTGASSMSGIGGYQRGGGGYRRWDEGGGSYPTSRSGFGSRGYWR